MHALNFTVFQNKVADGSKRQAIRRLRKRPICVGDTLSFYTGMRTQACRRLREDAVCTDTYGLMRLDGYWWAFDDDGVHVGEIRDMILVALFDGFSGAGCLSDFERFFSRYADGEILQVIRW